MHAAKWRGRPGTGESRTGQLRAAADASLKVGNFGRQAILNSAQALGAA
jgi:hypothetical protein